MLYPVTNHRRTAISLNGLWNFQIVGDDHDAAVPLDDPIPIGVPGSYQELYPDPRFRDHVGLVCYERTLTLPVLPAGSWRLRIGAAGNRARVYVDGGLVGSHNGGFLPIDLELPIHSPVSESFRLSVVLDSRLDYKTLPIGEVEIVGNRRIQRINHDFANETGIHRDVLVYSVPERPIRDAVVKTSGHEGSARIAYSIDTDAPDCRVEVVSPDGKMLGSAIGTTGSLTIVNPMLWDLGAGRLHTLRIRTATDAYDLPFGIRDVELKDGRFLLNGKPVFFKGFGMHEDHGIVGKASIAALNVRDFALLDWIHANSFRTSHYPYSDEMMDLADRQGILVIDEVPAVGMNFWSGRKVFTPGTVDDRTLAVHKDQLTELIARDKNHPSVVMVSVANEATTYEDGAVPYFTEVFRHARTLTDLPLMIVENVGAAEEKVAGLADVVGLNKYLGWYVEHGDLTDVPERLARELTDFHEKFHKPILVTEFGADTIAGTHRLPPVAFSEEFQVDFIKTYHETIKTLPFVVGEHVWNFADFMTKQGVTRFDGNKKGVFTRDRQPKMAAHWLRDAWK